MSITRRCRPWAALFFAAICLWPFTSRAENYPTRPITFIVGNPPGGSSDLIARAVANKMQESLGQPIVVENRPGASEIVGAEALARSAPDGYTMAIFSNAMAINETMFPKRHYKVLRDFIPVVKLAELPFAIMVRADVPAKDLKELVALAKSEPGKLNYGHVGVGAPHYLTMEWFKRAAGINIVPVPYKGSGPLFTGLLGGEIQVTVGALGGATPFIKAGKVRVLAAMADKRPTSMPNLPTVAEFGYPKFDLVPWMGIFVRSGTPPQIVAKLQNAAIAALGDPKVKAYFDKFGLEASPLRSDAFTALLRHDIKAWAGIIKDVGVKVVE